MSLQRGPSGIARRRGGGLARSPCGECCGPPPPCNLLRRFTGCPIWPGGPPGEPNSCGTIPPEPIYACETYRATILYNGLCYGATNDAYWRDPAIPGNPGYPPLPAGAVVVDSPVVPPGGCLDPVCGNPGGLWVRGYPCEGDPATDCPPFFICRSALTTCRYFRLACPGDSHLICYRFDPSLPVPDHELPPDAIRIQGGTPGFGYTSCCECMDLDRQQPDLPSCDKVALTDYPCLSASRCAFEIPAQPGQPAGVELRPCRCCCSDEDEYAVVAYFRRRDNYIGSSHQWQEYVGSGSSTWDPVNRRLTQVVLGMFFDGQHITTDRQTIEIPVSCAWANMPVGALPYGLINAFHSSDSGDPHRCSIGSDGDGNTPEFRWWLDSYGSTNTCTNFGYSATYHNTYDGVLRMTGRDQFLLSRVYRGRCAGACGPAGNNAVIRGGKGCAGCEAETGL